MRERNYWIIGIIIYFAVSAVVISYISAYTITGNARVVKINQTWQGDTAPYENITWIAPDGSFHNSVFSCNYYQMNTTFVVSKVPWLIFSSNWDLAGLPVKGC